MQINKVTISGADNMVSQNEMFYTQQVFPFVEWGILVSTKRMGTPRYPTLKWMRNLPKELNISYHLCGDIVKNLISNPSPMCEWLDLSESNNLKYGRLQLNFSFKEDKDYMGTLVDLGMLAAVFSKYNVALVLAYNKGSKKNLDAFMKAIPSAPDNIHYLYDSSGGRGTEIKSFNPPLKNYTGYAGGINPDNVLSICNSLTEMEQQDEIWIDMETGVRTGDKFDIQKANDVLSICKNFVKVSNSIPLGT